MQKRREEKQNETKQDETKRNETNVVSASKKHNTNILEHTNTQKREFRLCMESHELPFAIDNYRIHNHQSFHCPGRASSQPQASWTRSPFQMYWFLTTVLMTTTKKKGCRGLGHDEKSSENSCLWLVPSLPAFQHIHKTYMCHSHQLLSGFVLQHSLTLPRTHTSLSCTTFLIYNLSRTLTLCWQKVIIVSTLPLYHITQ